MAELLRLRRTRAPRAPHVLDRFSLSLAETATEIDEIRRFRRETYLERSSLVIDDDRAVDERGLLFGLRSDAQLVGCARVLARPDPDAGISRFDHPVLREYSSIPEVGRLAVSRHRSPLLLLALLGLGARWMLEHSDEDRFVAYCNPRLVRAYERVGASDLGVEVTAPDSERPYRFVVGRFDDAAELALGLVAGFCRAHASKAERLDEETEERRSA